jgi:hypothetical protein
MCDRQRPDAFAFAAISSGAAIAAKWSNANPAQLTESDSSAEQPDALHRGRLAGAAGGLAARDPADGERQWALQLD